MPRSYFFEALFFITVLFCIPAQNSLAASPCPENNTPEKNIKYVEIVGNYQWGLAKGSEHCTSETLALGYQLNGPFFLHAEAGHCHFKLKDDNSRIQADGVIVNLLLRWHVLDSRYMTFFAEGGIGVLSCNDNIPSEGMETNTVPQAGIGMIIPIRCQAQIVLGGRYMHISHGLWKPHISNPGFNSAGIYAGLHFLF